jgi:plasmid stabilization system protein ParE
MPLPLVFRQVYGEVRRALVSRFPYAVFYRIEMNRIVVLTVLHSARDPKLWPQTRKVPR